jgi:hypothetical protein
VVLISSDLDGLDSGGLEGVVDPVVRPVGGVAIEGDRALMVPQGDWGDLEIRGVGRAATVFQDLAAQRVRLEGVDLPMGADHLGEVERVEAHVGADLYRCLV